LIDGHALHYRRQAKLHGRYRTPRFMPLHKVWWLGNTAAIANSHYLQEADEHFVKATAFMTGEITERARDRARSTLTPGPSGTDAKENARENAGEMQVAATSCDGMPEVFIPPRGVEQLHENTGKAVRLKEGGAELGAPGARESSIDLELAAVITAWPTLPMPIKRGVLAMIFAVNRSE
jgi:hypothetical protein